MESGGNTWNRTFYRVIPALGDHSFCAWDVRGRPLEGEGALSTDIVHFPREQTIFASYYGKVLAWLTFGIQSAAIRQEKNFGW